MAQTDTERTAARISRRRFLGLSTGLLTAACLGYEARSLFAGQRASAAEGAHWDYYSHGGPEGWGELRAEGSEHPAYPDCNLFMQSPVNIPTDVAPLQTGLAVDYRATPLNVLNNGHTVQVNYAGGSTLVSGGKTYDLLQFHFHSPSEHELDGEPSVLEGHFVHRAADGEYAVLGVMMVEGGANAAFERFLDATPEHEGVASTGGSIDGADLLPADLAFYGYSGSFTTPACTQGVRWHVLGEPLEVSADQIETFRSLEFLYHEGQFVGNARPVQPLYGRFGVGEVPDEAEEPLIAPPSTGSAGLAAR